MLNLGGVTAAPRLMRSRLPGRDSTTCLTSVPIGYSCCKRALSAMLGPSIAVTVRISAMSTMIRSPMAKPAVFARVMCEAPRWECIVVLELTTFMKLPFGVCACCAGCRDALLGSPTLTGISCRSLSARSGCMALCRTFCSCAKTALRTGIARRRANRVLLDALSSVPVTMSRTMKAPIKHSIRTRTSKKPNVAAPYFVDVAVATAALEKNSFQAVAFTFLALLSAALTGSGVTPSRERLWANDASCERST
mmetsp:Transcript_108588/g.306135  ORF Transcript_108588/g.306135 Transcript_108588/m.306135 type:complete len:251 (+) Transcript_108588:700-1452(+)